MRHSTISARIVFWASACLLNLWGFSGLSLRGAPVSGQAVYQKHCALCHDQQKAGIPNREALQQMSVARIMRTLEFGLMMNVARPLRRDERQAVAGFLGKAVREPGPPASAFCAEGQSILSGDATGNWNGWSSTSSNTRFQTTQRAGLGVEQVRRLKLKWAYGFSGDMTAFGAATILNGTIFVGAASGAVQALDAKTGCIYWFFQGDGPVRSAPLLVGVGSREELLFGDLTGWVYALDARTGRLLWKRKPESHEAARLTGSAVTYDGIVYIPVASAEESRSLDPQYPCCTFRGSLVAIRPRDGSVIWKRYMAGEPTKTGVNSAGTSRYGPSGAGIWSAPTIDPKRGVLYVTTGDNYSQPATATSDAIMALELKSGRVVWTQQTLPGDAWVSACRTNGPNCPPEAGPDYDYGSSALLLSGPGGRDILVAGQKSGVVYALDPDNKGKILWQTRVGKGSTVGGVEWGMASDGQKVYAAVSDVVRLEERSGSTPGPLDPAMYDPVQGGGLTALRLEDGAKAWFAPSHPCNPPRPGCSPAQPAALTAIPGVVFSGSLDGHLRAYSTEDGQVVWDFDSAKEFTTVNGVRARGGSLNGAGPVIVGSMLFVNSGYAPFSGMPGNVLLAFAPDSEPK